MSVSAEAVANRFLELARESGQPLTNMQLQKLVYIAHGFCLALLDEPLIYNDVKAWRYGPVYPKLYKKLSKFGAGKVTEPIEAEDKLSRGGKENDVLEAVWNVYGKMSGSRLSTLTHKPDTPWDRVWHEDEFGIIPDESIKEHYRNLLELAEHEPAAR